MRKAMKAVSKAMIAFPVLLAVSVTARAESIEYACVTEASRDAVLSLTVAGRITDIHHREGAVVKAGTPLIALERRVEDLEVQRRKLVWQDTSELEAAKVQAETLNRLLKSTEGLYEATGSVSREKLSRMELEAKKAEAELQRLLIAEEREEVEFELAEANLGRRTLKAPFAGTIVDIRLDEGEIGEANQPLVKLVDTERGFLDCNVEEHVGRKLSKGDSVPVSIQAGNDRWTSTGEVVFASPVVDPGSGLMRVKIEFENPDRAVRPGVPGYVTLESASPLLTGNTGSE